MPKISQKERRLVTYVSIALAMAIIVSTLLMALVAGANFPIPWDTFMVVALMIGLFPPAAVNVIDSMWRASVDRNIPRFLREVAEADEAASP